MSLALDLVKCDFDYTRGPVTAQDSPNGLRAHWSPLTILWPLPRMCLGACKPEKNWETRHEIEIMSEPRVLSGQSYYFIFLL